MKNKFYNGFVLTWVFLCLNTNLRAQFFKDILNSVKQTAQNRANSKANQTTNKALDKVDSTTNFQSHANSGTGLSNSDTASTNRVLRAFANAAAANPNDTSSADLTMKALGMMVSGPTVSKQDSAAAINSYKSAIGGSGIHYTYLIVSSMKNGSTARDSSEVYFTNSGEGRAEMRIPIPGVQMNKMITIGHVNQPRFSVLLHPEKKTYSLNIIDTSLISRDGNYQVTKIGVETLEGYSCTHARLTDNRGPKSSKYKTVTDIWTSTEVPGYAIYRKALSMGAVQPGMMKALEKAGCGGFFVKMDVEGSSSSMVETLIKADDGRLSADLFRIPAGYTESNENVISSLFNSSKK